MFRLPDSWVWDFWTIQDGATHHLFFLYASRALHDPDRRHLRAAIGHAVSTDLRSWQRVADALVHGEPGAFDATATWTGSVVRGPDGRWHLFYTGTTVQPDGLLQQIGVATSTDLMRWDKHPRPLLRADRRWYETLGQSYWRDEHFRDPWVFADPDGAGWHMLITARARHGAVDDRGVVGHARSADLLTWEVLPPLTEPGSGFGHLEVLQVARVQGRWVLLFNCLATEFAAGRAEAGGPGGVWAARAQSPLGPFDIAGATRLTDERLYVGKLMQDRTGGWVMLAFRNDGPDGFVGSLTDPMPVHWDAGRLVVEAAGALTQLD